ncbi:MAG: 3-dehydroquinate synthase family protein, partial [bacterium]
MERNIEAVMAREADALATAIARCCANKARIVARDERESGARALLNLGHTFGHAIETGSGYGRWLHGEAVAIGIAMAAHLSARMQWLPAAQLTRINRLLVAAALPCDPFDGLDAERMLALMQVDKKSRGGHLRLVLPRVIGETAIVADYPRDALAETVAHFTES